LTYEEQKRRRAQNVKLKRDLEKIMILVEEIETKISAIDKQFADENFFSSCDFNLVRQMEQEKQSLTWQLDDLVLQWEQLEVDIKKSEEV
jgi:hypothetical protein